MEERKSREIAIQLRSVKKRYKLGQIGGGTLQGDLQSWWARVRGKEDPNTKIGTDQRLIGQTFMALDGIDLTIYKGERIGIIGHNGAGKSTMLKLLSRVTAPTEGEIDIYGRVASMLEVGTGFSGEMTGRENIYMNGAILGMTKAEIDAKMEQIIDFSEVRDFIDTPVKRYSSGMYVKLAFSVAAHLDSEIMIMDEVLAVGDMAFQKKCLDKMSNVSKNQGRTILYVSHNMNTIRQLCERVIVLNHGKIVFDGAVENGIGVYMNVSTTELIKRYELADLPREAEGYGQKIRLQSLEFLYVDVPRYNATDMMKCKIAWKLYKNIDNLHLRMEVYNSSGAIVGMSESADFLQQIYNTVIETSFSFVLYNLCPDCYYFRLSLFTLGEGGVHEGLDDVRNVKFEISSPPEGKTRWLKQYWGNVRLSDIQILEVGK